MIDKIFAHRIKEDEKNDQDTMGKTLSLEHRYRYTAKEDTWEPIETLRGIKVMNY